MGFAQAVEQDVWHTEIFSHRNCDDADADGNDKGNNVDDNM